MAKILAVAASALLAAFLLSPGAAEAAKPNKKAGAGAEAILKRLDTNNDGKVDKEEFGKLGAAAAKGKKGKGRKAPGFDQLDTNKDGSLSLDELKAAGGKKAKKAKKA